MTRVKNVELSFFRGIAGYRMVKAIKILEINWEQ
jgi:hypothetical protein